MGSITPTIQEATCSKIGLDYGLSMGKVTVQIKVQNWGDIELIATGRRKRLTRHMEVDTLVDTGAVNLYLQSGLIGKLGLRLISEVRSCTMSDTTVTRRVFSPVD